MLEQPWRIELFGGLKAEQGRRTITRFRTHKTAALLAYLAYYRNRMHPREELIELLWPDTTLEAGRVSLRTALASLRAQLEPPGAQANSVLIADRVHLQLNPHAITTDVADFESMLKEAAQATDPEARIGKLTQAIVLYRGELLPGHYEDWAILERERLAESAFRALHQLALAAEQHGDRAYALEITHRALTMDPLREEIHGHLMRLYAAEGNLPAVQRQYQELERLLREVLDTAPDAATRKLLTELTGGTSPPSTHHLPPVLPTKERPRSPSARPASPEPPSVSLVTPDAVLPAPHLPLPLTRFFGREQEIEWVLAQLQPPDLRLPSGSEEKGETHYPRTSEAASDGIGSAGQQGTTRLFTLTGIGGTGKTRLALEAAQRLRGAYGGRVWFVLLADLTDPCRLGDVIADTLLLPRTPSRTDLEQIVEALDGQPALLVLDNFEHLLAAEAEDTADADPDHAPEPNAPAEGTLRVKALLQRLPQLACLATSRQPLGIEGERELPLSPLPTPGTRGMPERLMEFPSVQLFVDRAQAVKPDFQVTPRNASAVAALCHRLEGIPLALELAAAWARTLTPAQILSRLESRFDLLVTRRRDYIPRHQTLRAAIEWSCRLLSPELQRFFAHLAVFAGGWTLEAAEQVCEQPQALDALTQLQERSLVIGETTEISETAMRFRMLETLRDYAQEQLSATEWAYGTERHAAYFLQMAEESEQHQTGPDVKACLDRLEQDHDNLRAALQRSLAQIDGQAGAARWGGDREGEGAGARILTSEPEARLPALELGLRLAGALWRFWYVRIHISEGRMWMESLLARAASEEKTSLHAKVLTGAANLAYAQSDVAGALALHLQALEIRRKIGHTDGIIATLGNLGILALNRGDLTEARALQEEALALARTTDNRVRLSNTLNNLGNVAVRQEDYTAARRCFEEGLALKRTLGDVAGSATILTNLGDVSYCLGDYRQAQAYLEEGLALKREVGDQVGIAIALVNLGNVFCAQGQYDAALRQHRESLALWREMGHKLGIAHVLEGLAQLATAQRRTERAVWLYGAATSLREAIASPLTEASKMQQERTLAEAHRQLGEEAYTSCWDRGYVGSLEQNIIAAMDLTEAPERAMQP
ncbi:MAG TPA: tetratricopeptide repeat protein [Chthonomonadaceae bacterium]|nr:tetratricopeptide repeat protein [Chthonomonadaceae bacterium]